MQRMLWGLISLSAIVIASSVAYTYQQGKEESIVNTELQKVDSRLAHCNPFPECMIDAPKVKPKTAFFKNIEVAN